MAGAIEGTMEQMEAAWRGHEQSGPPLPAVEARPPSDERERPQQKVAEPPIPDQLRPAPPATDDDRCLCRLQEGDTDALGELFERYYRPLFQFFTRLGESHADDLAQEVFVRVLKYRHSYRPGTRVRTWLYTIARNVRHTHRHRRRGEVAWDEVYAPSFSPPDEADASQQRRYLALALGRLPEDKRELLVLCRYQELDYADVATLLGCSVGAVKVRVHRAVRELRQRYFELTQGGPS